MTEKELRFEVISIAESYLGCKVSDGSHKKIIDLYNSHTPLARGYKVKYTDAWCATFGSAVAIAAGLTDIIPTECGCGNQIALFKKLGCWQENDAYVPQIGDYIFYDWQDGADYATTDNTGEPDHVGIVVSVSGNSIKVIEGNKSNAVGYRTIAVNGRYIRGYGVPKYSSKATSAATTTVSTTTTPAAKKIEAAQKYDKSLAGTYKVNVSAGLRLRTGVGTAKNIIATLKNGATVTNYGYYNLDASGVKWLYVKAADGTLGFCSFAYLKKS